MSTRLRRARRILAVQTQLDRLAEWRLIDLQSQAATLEDREQALVHFMQEESAFSGIFPATMMRRLQTLVELRAAAVTGQEAQRARHLEERGRLRRAERIVETLEGDAQRSAALGELAEAVEAAARDVSQGSGKVAAPLYQAWHLAREFSGVD